MPDLNNMISDASSLTKKVSKDLKMLAAIYEELNKEAFSVFRDEYVRQDGKLDGLEDFYSLVAQSKGNKKSVGIALNLIYRLKDISDFSASEESIEEEVSHK